MIERPELNYREVLASFTYKPNFFISAAPEAKPGPDGIRRWWFTAIMYVENSRAPLQMWDIKEEPFGVEELYVDYRRVSLPRAPSVYSPRRPLIEVRGQYIIPPEFFRVGDDFIFLEWVVRTLREMEWHELDEWARYKGELLNDPHKRDGI